MGYKDMTFCTESTCAYFADNKCPRALTDTVKAAGTKWWGSENFPVTTYTDTPECFTVPHKDGPDV
jgi:hypothetical protein|tara:strand:+ start:27 stop:224 length:198 start_codon:yes stop_codon:yes gene_type:complete